MKLSRAVAIHVPLIIALLMGIGFSQTDSSKRDNGNGEKLLVLPFHVHGLRHEDAVLLTNSFANALKESRRFNIVLSDSVQDSGQSPDPRFLAQTGITQGVQKVVHVSAVRREKLTALQIRLVNVSDASLLYAERVDYSGEFASLLSDVVPQQARILSKAHLDAKTPWAKAAFLFGACLGAIVWIFWHFRRRGATASKRSYESVTSTQNSA